MFDDAGLVVLPINLCMPLATGAQYETYTDTVGLPVGGRTVEVYGPVAINVPVPIYELSERGPKLASMIDILLCRNLSHCHSLSLYLKR